METGTTSSMIYHLKSKHEDIFAMHQFTRDPSLPSYPRKRLDAGHRLPGGADVTDPITGLPIRQVNITRSRQFKNTVVVVVGTQFIVEDSSPMKIT
jgi:hypothetical protein